jgi:hypothetical protein
MKKMFIYPTEPLNGNVVYYLEIPRQPRALANSNM